MLKKTISYEDFDGNKRTEDFYFNLTQAELAEMEMMASGGLDKLIARIISAKDPAVTLSMFKDIIKKSYGVKSPDGKRMDKSEEAFREFAETEAYSVLFMELATDANAAAEFCKGIMPKGVSADIKNMDMDKLSNSSPSQIIDMLNNGKS